MRTGNRKLFSMLSGALCALAILLSLGLPQEAHAAICKDSLGNDVKGFTVALVFCVRSSITDALTGSHITNIMDAGHQGYLTQVIQFLTAYKWAAITLAIALYGVKLATVNVEELLKESSGLLFRIAFVVFICANLGAAGQTQLYNSPNGSGIYGIAVDFAGELVSFVSLGFAKITQHCSAQFAALPAGVNQQEYSVWQAFDCIFEGLLGGTAGATFAAAAIILALAAAIFSGGLGVAVLVLAVTLFVMILLSLGRAVYTYILSYFVLALLIIIGALIVPLFVFESEYTKGIFWKWVSLIVSTMMQPLFLVEFLSFFMMTDYQFIYGSFSSQPDTPTANGAYVFTDGTQARCNPQPYAEYADANNGHPDIGNGSGVCSFPQLLASCGGNITGCIKWEPIVPVLNLHWKIPNVKPTNGVTTALHDAVDGLNFVVNMLEDAINAVVNSITGFFFKVPKLVNFPLQQFFITLFAFIIITFVLMELMKKIPEMAERMTISVGIGLMRMAQVPMEAAIVRAVKSGGDAMKGSMQSTLLKGGGQGNLKGMGKSLAGGGAGAAKSVARGGLGAIGSIVKGGAGAAKSAAKGDIKGAAQSLAGGGTRALKSLAGGGAGAVKSLGSGVKGAAKSAGQMAKGQGVRDVGRAAGSGAKSALRSIGNSLLKR